MKCVLHIGTETTGTGTFQAWLERNRPRLRKQGVALSSRCGQPNNHLIAAYVKATVPDPSVQSLPPISPSDTDAFVSEFPQTFSKEVHRKRKRGGSHTFIYSCRHLYTRLTEPHEIEALAAFLRRDFDEVRIVCNVREQSEMVASLYSRAMRRGYHGTLEMFSEQATPDHLEFNHHAALCRWADVFGRDAIDVAVFDRTAVEGDMCAPLLRRMVPEISCKGFGVIQNPRNRRLGPLQCATIRAFNEALRWFNEPTPARLAMVRAVAQCDALHTPSPPHPDAARIGTLFAPCNRALGEAFLGGIAEPFTPAPPLSAAQLEACEATLAGLAGVTDDDRLRRIVSGDAAQRLSPTDAEALMRALGEREGGKGLISDALALFDERRAHSAGQMDALRERARLERRDVTVEDILGTLDVDAERREKRLAELTPASRRFLVYFTPRSGSSWLNAAMNETGVLGRGGELFNIHFVERLGRKAQADTLGAYCETLLRTNKTPNDVFSTQLTYFHLKRISDKNCFYEYFPPQSPSVYLMRESIVRQAISLYKATETSVFHSADQSGADIEKARRFDGYDGEKIMGWVRHIFIQEEAFERHFSEWGIAPLRLSYERMFADEARVLPLIADWFGVELPAAPDREANPHRMMASATTESIEARFRREYAKEIAKIERRRRPILRRLDGWVPSVPVRLALRLQQRVTGRTNSA